MVWTRSAYPSLKSGGQQLTEYGEKENYKHMSLLFRGYKYKQLKGEVSSLKCSLFRFDLRALPKSLTRARLYFFPDRPFYYFRAFNKDWRVLCRILQAH